MPFPAVTFLTPVKVNKTACCETDYIIVVILVIESCGLSLFSLCFGFPLDTCIAFKTMYAWPSYTKLAFTGLLIPSMGTDHRSLI
jgi:hypothetical protein